MYQVKSGVIFFGRKGSKMDIAGLKHILVLEFFQCNELF